jgi:hypothetical protein
MDLYQQNSPGVFRNANSALGCSTLLEYFPVMRGTRLIPNNNNKRNINSQNRVTVQLSEQEMMGKSPGTEF